MGGEGEIRIHCHINPGREDGDDLSYTSGSDYAEKQMCLKDTYLGALIDKACDRLWKLRERLIIP